jgi:hypothetical protein
MAFQFYICHPVVQDAFLPHTTQTVARHPGFADPPLAIPPHHPPALNPSPGLLQGLQVMGLPREQGVRGSVEEWGGRSKTCSWIFIYFLHFFLFLLLPSLSLSLSLSVLASSSLNIMEFGTSQF